MINRLFKLATAALFPWLVLLFHNNPGGALVALVMQASVIGWIPASVWAWRAWYPPLKKETKPSNPG